MTVIRTQDTGKGAKWVPTTLEAVLRKIELWHQGSIASYKISYRDTAGRDFGMEWDGKEARIILAEPRFASHRFS